MDATRLNTFLENLQAADLLSPAQLEEIARGPLAQTADPAPLAKDLVQRGLLTSYQVNQLSRGHGRGLVLGPYRIVDRLGEGGMGQVFKAYHKILEGFVALKVIRKERVTNPDAIKRFQREVESTASLVHPNVITFYDAGQIGATNYLAMEFVDGTDLSKLVKQSGALAPDQASEYIRQAALGLQHAHERGLVHRDIKPSNLLVAGVKSSGSGIIKANPAASSGAMAGPCVKILDLGLARLQGPEAQETNLTRIGCVVGTPEYLAPEQAKNSSAVDIRADLYSLGCAFFYLLAGQAPYRGESPTEVMIKHLTEPIPSLETFRGDVPAPVQAIIKKLMAKKPAERFQTPAELAEALQPFCAIGSAGSPPPSGVVRKKKKSTPAAEVTTSTSRKTLPEKIVVPSRMTRFRRKPRNRGANRAAVLGAAVLLIGGAVVLGMAGYTAVKPTGGESAAVSNPIHETTYRTTPSRSAPTRIQSSTLSKPVPTTQPRPESDPSLSNKLVLETKPETKKPEPKPEIKKPGTKPEIKKPDTKTETKKPDTKTETKKPDTKPGPQKLAAPEPARVLRMKETIRRERRNEFVKQEIKAQQALAEKLIRESSQVKNDPTRCFALLSLAVQASADAANLELALQVVEMIDRQFAVDAWTFRQQVLLAAAESNNPPKFMRMLVSRTLQIAERAVSEDNYPAAIQLTTTAAKAASHARSKALPAYVDRRAAEIAEVQRQLPKFQPAADVLKAKPDDPQANFQWGSFVCLLKGQWDEGLPLLAVGNEETLKDLAQRDLAKPKDSGEQTILANDWFKFAETQTGLAKTQALLHARTWYQTALARLPDGPRTVPIERRVKEIEKLTGRDAETEKLEAPAKPFNAMTVEELKERARQLYREKKYAEAVAAYNYLLQRWIPSGLRSNPTNRRVVYESFMARGHDAMERQKFDEAARDFNTALRWVPNDRLAQDALRDAQAAAKQK